MRYAVVASRFNEVVVQRLVEGARSAFREHDVPEADLTVLWAPGAFELPLVAKRLAASGEYAAVVCLGAVIRGETSHYDFVAGEAARGIQQVMLQTGVPVVFGVLTTENLDQAMARAGGDHGNKGWDSALTAMEMAALLQTLPAPEEG